MSSSTGERVYRGESAEQRRGERRERLLDSALEVFGSAGFEAGTLDAICAGAGLTKRYFYESFGSREDLLRALYERLVDDVSERVIAAVGAAEPDAEAMSRAGLDTLFAWFEDDPRVARVVLFEMVTRDLAAGGAPGSTGKYAEGLDRLTRFSTRVLEAGTALTGPELATAAAGLAGAALHIAFRWVLAGYDRPRPAIVDGVQQIYAAVLARGPSLSSKA